MQPYSLEDLELPPVYANMNFSDNCTMTDSYEIIARKYRPRTFEEMIGQKALVQTLKNAVAGKRIAQAYLFSGMRGVGKTSAARILAKALNCQSGPTPTPCNQCEFCRAINEDRLTDVLEIDGASNTGVDDVRQLREGLRYKALQARYKIIIIDEVHMLSKNAFNALLKTLEEPPENTVFILATTEFHKVPATIVSRCQSFEFKKISHRDIVNHLLEIAKKESITISDYGLSLIAEAAEGSLRDAQSLLDQAVAFGGLQVSDADLKEILGTMSRDLLLEFSTAVLGHQPQSIFPLVEKVIDNGYDLRFFYKELIQHFRNLLLVRSLADPRELLPLGAEDLGRLTAEAGRATTEELLRCLVALQNGESGLRYSSHPQIYLESFLIKLCHFKDLLPLKDLLEEFENIKAGLQPTASPAAAPPAASGLSRRMPDPASRPRLSPEPPRPSGAAIKSGSAKDLLPKTIEALKKQKSSLAAILAQCESAVVKDEPMDIRFSSGKGFSAATPVTLELLFGPGMAHLTEALQQEARLVEKTASEVSGLRVKLKVLGPQGEAQAGREREVDLALKDAGVRNFMDKLKAQVLTVERIKREPDRD
jgi:DNA polymerase-3 subunit gamma/tau